MSKPIQLRLRTFVPAGAFYHVARTHVSRTPSPQHTHDFAEVFWIEAGAGVHLLNGRPEELQTGDLVFVQPSDVHGFQARGPAGLTLLNVAFAAATLDFLRSNYGAFPHKAALTPPQLRRVQEWAEVLAVGEQTRLRRDAFLLQLLVVIGDDSSPTALPDWLRHAISQYGRAEHLTGGAPALARLAGRSPEHVNRTIRQALGKTTTDVVNELRLEHAARQLRMTDHKITEIALDCGLENLGYFYRIFAKRYGVTPRRYRLRERAVVR